MTSGTRSVSNLKICLKKERKKEHNCDARYHTGRRNVITLFMMSLYKDGCLYGEGILHGSLLHGSYAWVDV